MLPDLPLRLALACAGTYEDSAVPQWEDDLKTVHVHLSLINGVHVIAFEGTTDFQEWLIDFMALRLPVALHPTWGSVHRGFARDVMLVAPKIAAYLESLRWPQYYVTGHSKGAGEALLFHAFMTDLGHPPIATCAFEAPRVGTAVLRDYLSGPQHSILQTATVNLHGKDIITRVPFDLGWLDVRDPLLLRVPDLDDVVAQHKIPAVIAGLQATLGLLAPEPLPAGP